MKNYRFFVFFLVVLFALGLTACERSASTPYPSSGAEEKFPLPAQGTQKPMDFLENIATQTAMAGSAGAQDTGAAASTDKAASSAEGEATPEEGSESTPAPEATASADTQSEEGGGRDTTTITEYKVPNTYTLQAGEFPYCIARRFNISPSALLNANGLSAGSTVYPGTSLTIPKGAAPFNNGPRALRTHPTKHTVQRGETVYSIACLFGDVDPRAIESANNLTGSYTLSVGQVLQIP